MSKISGNRKGFTIIEVLIVLAIAGLIILLIFLAVPTVRKHYRNLARKEAAAYVMTAMEQYRNEFNHFPMSETHDDRDIFKAQLAAEGAAKNFNIRYPINYGPHEYPYNGGDSPADWREAYDQISIQHGHVCNREPGLRGGDPDFPIISAPGSTTDHDYAYFAVWTLLEDNVVLCLDTQN